MIVLAQAPEVTTPHFAVFMMKADRWASGVAHSVSQCFYLEMFTKTCYPVTCLPTRYPLMNNMEIIEPMGEC